MIWLRKTFVSLHNRNYRLYFTGNAVSLIGQWMQRLGQVWLVLELTDSGTLLGVAAALQHLPTLLLGPSAGLLADRVDKRRVVLWTESAAGICALALGYLTLSGLVRLWMVLVLAFSLGLVDALNQPAKKSLIYEMVGPGMATNAITLDSVMFNVARIVGPAIAGVLIAGVGIAPTFFANAASYLAVVLALTFVHTDDLLSSIPVRRGPGQVRDGFRYVRETPSLAIPLLVMTVSGLLAYEWPVTLPLLASDVFGGDAQTLGLMFSAMGLGAVVGGLVFAGSLKPSTMSLAMTAWIFSIFMLAVVVAPTLQSVLAVLVALGGASIILRAVATALVQIRAVPEMRGRVTALLTVALSGTTPIGGPLVGWIGQTLGVRVAFAIGGIATAIAAFGAMVHMRRHQP